MTGIGEIGKIRKRQVERQIGKWLEHLELSAVAAKVERRQVSMSVIKWNRFTVQRSVDFVLGEVDWSSEESRAKQSL